MDQEELTVPIEKQLQALLAKMKEALAQEKNADFKSFWEAKHQCLELFKENIPYTLRASFWEEYVNLSQEAKRLQEILAEHTNFTLEQINLALEATKKDLEHFSMLLQAMPSIAFPHLKPMENKYPVYQELQKELNLLASFSSRIHSLRQEIVRMALPFKRKNHLLQALSEMGEQIFPRKKNLIQELSSLFEKHVNEFAEKFSLNHLPFYLLRQDIQAFQALAKILTISPKTFNSTRVKLSEMWDLIRKADEERKQTLRKKQELSNKSMEEAELWLKNFAQELTAYAEEENLISHVSEFKAKILKLPLMKKDLKFFEERINTLSSQALETLHQEKDKKIQEKELKKKQRIEFCKNSIDQLLLQASNLSVNVLTEKLDHLKQEMQTCAFSREEQLLCKRMIKPMEDLIEEKKEVQTFAKISSDKVNIAELQELLEQRKQKRCEIKDQIEQVRKNIAKSGCDFEEAMMYQEMLEVEKQRLDQAEALIAEIEKQLFTRQE